MLNMVKISGVVKVLPVLDAAHVVATGAIALVYAMLYMVLPKNPYYEFSFPARLALVDMETCS